MVDILFNIGRDLDLFTTQSRPQLRLTLDLFTKTDAARAMNTTSHVRRNKRTQVFILDDPFAIVVPRNIAAITNRQVLKFALATLVADRTIQRVVNEKELHRRFLSSDCPRRLGEHLHAFVHRLRAGRNRLGRTLHVDKAHAAVGRDAEFVVIAEPRYVRTDLVGHLDDHLSRAGFDRLAIDFNVYDVVTHSRYAAASGASSTMLRPLLRTMYSNS